MSSKTEKIKNTLTENLGKKCHVLYKQGRKKIVINNCRICAAYPSIFVISYTDSKTNKTINISFSYNDILTKTVCLSKV